MNALEELIRRVVPRRYRPRQHLEKVLLERSKATVLAGPFQGMKYVRQSCCSELPPKILGLYERALQPAVREIIATGFDRIVDVGAAEGYYAVGLALHCPRAEVIAFEMDVEARLLLQELARLNGVDGRIELHGRCGSAELARALETPGRAILVCDCEGYEEELLDLEQVPALRKSTILVELHESGSRGISERLRRRFEASHVVEEIWEEPEYLDKFPFPSLYAALLPQKYLSMALNENRGERMNWFWMKPKAPAR